MLEEQMRKKDSSIIIIANGNAYSGDNYIGKMFDILGNKVDAYGIHPVGGSQGREMFDSEK